ncbi:nucleotidyltransferase [Clostridium sp.]|uniref:nucleotidyltransferase n=1 Tax=Clostridium sp. TaxID=1506 RepID=UPI0026DCA8B6|nr:nucleotidyltransferase [Clostridium sp.]MDO5038172.1 nucleotidyltransferase [Clostridium sp.]
MNLTGIITEYNPFHLGHKYHLENAIKDTNSDGIVCVMSGDFMQRGTPAIIDKYTRAKIAVLNGVDLVLELPLVYSLSSAENFAFGGVKLLNSLNCINNIYFGSESGNLNNLFKIAHSLAFESTEYKENLKDNIKKGIPFHTARTNSLNSILPNDNVYEILSNSNNILAIEYIKSIIKLDSKIKPFTLKREGNNYNDLNLSKTFSSATSIRKCLKENMNLNILKNSIPLETYKELENLFNKNYNFVFENDMFEFLKYKILTNDSKLKNINDLSEGLDNKIKKEIINSKCINELILNIKSKRYTYTRINRILTSFFIGLEQYDLTNIKNYDFKFIRPLALNSTGMKILKEIKSKSNLKILNKIPKHIDDDILKINLLGTKAYSILNKSISPIEDYLKTPYIHK